MNIEDRCTKVLRESFYKSGISEIDVANRVGVHVKTLRSWIEGRTFPTFPQVVRWFIALRTRMIPWIMKMPYFEDDSNIKSKITEEELESGLIDFLHSLTPAQKERLYFIFCSEHGSAPEGLLEMVDAHLHTPLRDRYKIASSILLNYQMALANKEAVCTGEADPNIEILSDSINKGKEAIINGQNGYIRRNE